MSSMFGRKDKLMGRATKEEVMRSKMTTGIHGELYLKRIDLTDWVMHFIHDFNNEKIPELYLNTDRNPPTHVDESGNLVYSHYDFLEVDYLSRHYVDDAFDVLEKILFDGFIKATWSFRNGKPTIYGPTSAVCFTEMPLYALMQYSKKRNNKNFVNLYCVAVKRAELFALSGRPVIYGLSSKHKEASQGDFFNGKGLRCLASSCGLPLHEQYRYVATSLNKNYYDIDWTHEREWRWAFDKRIEYCPGLPIWRQSEHHKFSEIIMIVNSDKETKKILSTLKSMYDSGYNDFDTPYNKQAILNTYVTSLEEIAAENSNTYFRIDDLPLHSLPRIKIITPTQSSLELIRKAIMGAKDEAIKALEKARLEAIRNEDGHIIDIFGFASVRTNVSDSKITSALIHLQYAEVVSGHTYRVHVVTSGLDTEGGVLLLEEAAARAAAESLEKVLGQSFYVHSAWD